MRARAIASYLKKSLEKRIEMSIKGQQDEQDAIRLYSNNIVNPMLF